MSEPARHYQAQDLNGRPTPGPLRDWLAAMKAATTSAEQAPAAEKVAAFERPAAPEKAEPQAASWSPRVVTPPTRTEASEAIEDGDVSELMAENLMLKAKLKVESDRYDQLQGILAQELRRLRSHVEKEMAELHDLRAERDRLAELQTLFVEKLEEARARSESDAEELAQACSDRDLWMARAEALAQPLFQKR
ncbi:hypothetical protein MBUL_02323 [Methylobacterium bullatum]|uniref:Uncharacterized protein n=1 Tax=Methylobacterium bullatum TaxID=570505 RepID=A0A679J6T3_9HYPH|nr:hypothetical protein MBUL_02323 [Methylobacterium bullatum]